MEKIHSSRIQRAEQNTNEVELWQKRNRLLSHKMEKKLNSETEEEIERRQKFHRVIDLPKENEACPSSNNQKVRQIKETPEDEDIEIMTSDSENTIAVPAINFERYLGTTGVRYINMGKASKIQNNTDWDLEETIRQAEQKFSTGLKTISKETTNDEKLIKTLVCLERQTPNQIPEEYQSYKKNLSTRFGVNFYDDKIIIPKALSKSNLATTQRPSSANQDGSSGKTILVAENHQRYPSKMRRMHSPQNVRKEY